MRTRLTRRYRRTLAAAVLASVVGVGVVPSVAAADDRASWSEVQRALHGERVGGPTETTATTPSEVVVPEPRPSRRSPRARPARAPLWPSSAAGTVDVRIVGGTPVQPGGRSLWPGRVAPAVTVADRDATARAGVDGLVLEIDEIDEVDGPTAQTQLDVAIDYSDFALRAGGDWASRLRLVSLPSCSLTKPSEPRCREQVPLASSNDVSTSTVTARVSSTGATVLALAAAPSGPAGNWSATPLGASAAWQVSGSTGDFSWSYPLRVPPAPGGPAPVLALAYSSGSLDGKVPSANGQSSWIGDGWDLTTGFVERRYVPCAQDRAGNANNSTRPTGDLCWATDNATLVFGGQAQDLVKDAVTGTWRPKADDGTRVERLTGGWNDDGDGEHWKVTTTDGTQYFFGRGQRSAADGTQLNSAWTVPVFGNHAGEPCYAASFAGSACTQAWRWNLDYVVDPSGNTMTYTYETEANRYGLDLNASTVSYVRGGHLSSIEYGQRAGAEASGRAPLRVDFAVAERCIPSGSATCEPGQLGSATATSWPDVPADLICTSTSTCPGQVSPTFFTRKRLATITTKVLMGSSYQNVDIWTLHHTFPDPGDATTKSLWLDRIGHQGLVGTPITLPDVQFHGTQMANRVDSLGDVGPPMNRLRVTAIDSEAGARTSITYTPQDCAPDSLPASPETNDRRCFPVRWQPVGTGPSVEEYFHKYLVDTVVEDPNDDGSLPVHTSYRYVGGAAWHYDDNPLVLPAYRTWGQFRGYGVVDTVTGAPTAPTRTMERTRYFRGMHGDRLAGGGSRTADVDGIADVERLAGMVRETVVHDGVDGPWATAELNTPWISAPTATGADGRTSTMVGVAVTENRVAAPALLGGQRTTRTVTTFDPTYGTAVTIDDQGDVATSTDDRCTRLEYARNVASNILAAVRRSETVAVACSVAPSRPTHVVSDSRNLYDGAAYGAAPTRGLPTAVQRLARYDAGVPQYVTEQKTAYDAHGRPTDVTDALGRTTTTTYVPAAGGPVTATTVTSPDPDGDGPLSAHVTRSEVHPAWGAPVRGVDANGKVTAANLDALGRVIAVWLPGRSQSSQTPSTRYAYVVSRTAPDAVTTERLTAGGTYRVSTELYDGLLRPRQTQVASAARDEPGMVVTDTVYDSRGAVSLVNDAWFTTGAPAAVIVKPVSSVPARTRYVYDGVGRTVEEIFEVAEKERWRHSTTYGGDRVTVDPPRGAVPTTTVVDARGQRTELRQYTGEDPSGAFESTSYGYTPAGQLARVTDAAGNRWTFEYDLRGRQTAATDPDRGASSTGYDDAGQVEWTTDARGVTTAYVRDRLGRTTEVRDGTTSGPLRASWTYDTLAKGQVTSAVRHVGAASYTSAVTAYDDQYRPLGRSITIPAAEGALAGTYVTTLTYAPDGQVKSTRFPSAGGLGAETVTTTFDALGLPQRLSGGLGWGAYVAGTVYSAYGETLRQDLGNTYAQFVTHTYEAGTRRLERTRVTRELGVSADLDVRYTYDASGNPVSVVDAPPGKPADAQCFTFDGLQRLRAAWTPASADCAAPVSVASLGGPAPYWFEYEYDEAGNRAMETSRAAVGTTTRTYVYPGAGVERPHAVSQISQVGPTGTTTESFEYDAIGSTVGVERSGAPRQTYEWDGEGKLTSVKSGATVVGAHVYTADGERLVRRQGGTTTVYLPGGMELTLTTATGVVKATRHYAFNGLTVAVRTGTGGANVTSLVADTRGSAQLAVANGNQAVTQRRLDPFGRARGPAAATWPDDRGFLGKVTDAVGLVQVGARYYDPPTGRFLSVDPMMDVHDPQQWSAYSYANNNPVTYSDPTGLAPMQHDGGVRSTGAWSLTVSGLKGLAFSPGHMLRGMVMSGPLVQLPRSVRDLPANWRFTRDSWSQVHSWGDFGQMVNRNWNAMYVEPTTEWWESGDDNQRAYRVGMGIGYVGLTAVGPKALPKVPAPRLPSTSTMQTSLVAAVGRRTEQVIATQSNKQRGPVLSGVLDTRTGQLFFAQNHDVPPSPLHPSLQGRLDNFEGPAAPGKGDPGVHAEVYALNEGLFARPGAQIDEFLVYNERLRGADKMEPIPMCANCSQLLSGAQEVP